MCAKEGKITKDKMFHVTQQAPSKLQLPEHRNLEVI